MFLFDLFRSFLPAHNSIGFGASDFIELVVAFGVVGLLLLRGWLRRPLEWLSARSVFCMTALTAAPVLLRLGLLAHHPVPTPNVADEFGHLFVADTLRHFRLANPALALPQFFETFFILQQPTYSSIYPPGQGIALALGRLLFGTPWGGVVLFTGLFCGLCYWMLRGWTKPGWALAGGVLAVIEFGPLSQWMNSYWGGSLAATAGCLVFGALPRLRERKRIRDAVVLGIGLSMHLLTRPFESVFLVLAVVLFFAPELRRQASARGLLRPGLVAAAVVMPALIVLIVQNCAVTGSCATLPYQLSQYQYGVPATLTFQPNATPHRALTPQQDLEYQIQISFRGPGVETWRSYFTRLEYRVRFYRFFFLPPLYAALLVFVVRARAFPELWVIGTLALFALGSNFFPAFQFHYLAGITCLFILASVAGLERLSAITAGGLPVGAEAARVLFLLCIIHFGFWYGLHLFEDEDFSVGARQFETWNAINHQNPERRIAVNRQLAGTTGPQLVFVRYYPNHQPQEEWVWNEADVRGARVIWARDLGAEENPKLLAAYAGRHVWLLEPDFRPMPRLSEYKPERVEAVQPQQKSPFEEVR